MFTQALDLVLEETDGEKAVQPDLELPRLSIFPQHVCFRVCFRVCVRVHGRVGGCCKQILEKVVSHRRKYVCDAEQND